MESRGSREGSISLGCIFIISVFGVSGESFFLTDANAVDVANIIAIPMVSIMITCRFILV